MKVEPPPAGTDESVTHSLSPAHAHIHVAYGCNVNPTIAMRQASRSHRTEGLRNRCPRGLSGVRECSAPWQRRRGTVSSGRGLDQLHRRRIQLVRYSRRAFTRIPVHTGSSRPDSSALDGRGESACNFDRVRPFVCRSGASTPRAIWTGASTCSRPGRPPACRRWLASPPGPSRSRARNCPARMPGPALRRADPPGRCPRPGTA